MALLRINATESGLALHDTPRPAARHLCTMASRPGPAIIMVHGYKYAPGTADHCPHRKIFGHRRHSWPRQLGYKGLSRDEGLGIALGWYARGSLKEVHKRAARLGTDIAMIVALLRTHTPRRPVHIIAHSLGSEAALNALTHLPRGSVDRMVLLTGASFAGRAEDSLNSPAGRSVEVLNVTSRENDLFDAAFERLVTPERPGDRAIGLGIAARNVATVQLDCARSLEGLASLGLPIAAPARRVCHWSAYKRPGVMTLYNRFLRDPESLPLCQIAGVLPATVDPRWSRFFVRADRPSVTKTADVFALPVAPRSPRGLLGKALAQGPANEPA